MFEQERYHPRSQQQKQSLNQALKASLDEALIFVCDCEATGPNTKTDDVIEVTVAAIRGGRELSRFTSLVRPAPLEYPAEVLEKYWQGKNPPQYVPEGVTNLTGISDEEIRKAPAPAEVRDQLIEFLQGNIPENLPKSPESVIWGTYFGKMEQGYLKKLIGDWAPKDQNTFCIKSLVRKLIAEGVLPFLQEDLGNDLETFTKVVTNSTPNHEHHRSSGDVDMTIDSIRAVFKKNEFKRLDLSNSDEDILNTSFFNNTRQTKTIGQVLNYQGIPIQTPWELITDSAPTIAANLRKWNELVSKADQQKLIPLSAIVDDPDI